MSVFGLVLRSLCSVRLIRWVGLRRHTRVHHLSHEVFAREELTTIKELSSLSSLSAPQTAICKNPKKRKSQRDEQWGEKHRQSLGFLQIYDFQKTAPTKNRYDSLSKQTKPTCGWNQITQLVNTFVIRWKWEREHGGERSLNNLKHIIAAVGALPRCNCEMKPQRWFLLWYTYGKAGGGKW